MLKTLENRVTPLEYVELKLQIERYLDHPGELWTGDAELLKLLCAVENRGFEAAHALRPCGHSVGDYRAPNYPRDENNYSCVGCDRELAAVAVTLREAAEQVSVSVIYNGLGESCSVGIAEGILALITPEQESALDRHDAEIRTQLELEHQAIITAVERTHRLDKLRAVRDEAKWWASRYSYHDGYTMKSTNDTCKCLACERLATVQRAVDEDEARK